MRMTRRRLTSVRFLACGLCAGAIALSWFSGEARAQAYAGPFRGNFAGYYYSPGGNSGGQYFNPGYYANPAPAPAATPANTTVTPVTRAVTSTPVRPARHIYVNPADWSTGRTNYPVPLMKPWMAPLRYSVPN